MSDTFSKVCMIPVVCLLALIAFRPPSQPLYTPDVTGRSFSPQRITSRNPVYRVYEAEPDAHKICDILAKNWDDGGWELATAPIYMSGSNAKVILVLVQRW